MKELQKVIKVDLLLLAVAAAAVMFIGYLIHLVVLVEVLLVEVLEEHKQALEVVGQIVMLVLH